MQKKSDLKNLISLILWTMMPSVYLLIRMNIVSVNQVDMNILGQMEWFDLIDEIIATAFITPLYYLLKDKEPQKNGFSFVVSFGIYFLFTIVLSMYIGSISAFMSAEYAERYLLMQSVSMLIAFIGTFVILLFLIYERYDFIIILTVTKLLALSFCDYLLIPVFKDLGAAYSEIVVNTLIAFLSLFLIWKKKYVSFAVCNKAFLLSWLRIGSFSGLQIFLDNFIYAVIVCRMVNAVSESGNYWVANNFIWGWLLVPVTCLVQMIQKNALEKITFHNVWKYVLAVLVVWGITTPFWGDFIHHIMAGGNYKNILNILCLLVPYYMCYITAAVIDAWFVSKGKTSYLFINSVIVNILYYGVMYALFQAGIFTLNINFIVHLFGLGMLVHMLVSAALYVRENHKHVLP